MTDFPQQAPMSDAPAATGSAALDSNSPNVNHDVLNRIASLTRKERDMRSKFSSFEQERAQFQKEREELDRYRKLHDEVKTNPKKLLEQFGVDYGHLTEAILTPEDKTSALEQRLARIEHEREQQMREFESERKAAAMQKGLDIIRDLVNQNKDKFKFLSSKESFEDVIDYVVAQQQQTGEWIEPLAALEHFENSSYENAVEQARRLYEQGQLEQALGIKISAMDGRIEDPKADLGISLTNNMTQSSKPLDPTTDEKELLRRAVSAYQAARIKK